MPTPAPAVRRPNAPATARPAPRPASSPPPPPRETGQSITAGDLIESRYLVELGGFSEVRMMPDARISMGVVLGRKGKGKSSLFHSCPTAYIINVDISSTPRKPRGSVWPGVRPSDGLAVKVNPEYPNDPERGIPFQLTWGDVREKRDILLKLALADNPQRPTLIVLDTVDSCVPLIKAWQLSEWNKAHGETNPKDDWEDLPENKWTQMYDEVTQLGQSLRNVGYGFVWVGHLGDKMVSDKASGPRVRVRVENMTLCPGNLWNEISAKAEWIAVVDAAERPGPMKRVQKVDGHGRPVLGVDKKPVYISESTIIREVVMGFAETAVKGDAARMVKKRDNLPDTIVLPKEDPWGAFSRAVDAVTQED